MSKRLLVLAALGMLGSGAARAQESAASQTFKQRLRGQYLSSDTAQAIINLYTRRQMGGVSWIVGSGLAAARLATASAPSNPGGYAVRQESNPGVAFLAALPFMGYGAAKMASFSNAKLEKLLTSYAAGQPLPRAVRRKLKPRFFAQPIIQYQPVKAQPAK
jgi:hypothetical protein